MKRSFVLLLVLLVPPVAFAADFEPKHGEHICIIGNELADRMQHDGWLETLIHSRYPTRELVFRNLGFPGDEVQGFTDKPDFNHRLRSAAFGSSDQWLTHEKADVIFAFFGYNESFAGKEGLESFKKELERFIKYSLSQKYNGKSAPRIVLFSPIAHEDLKDPNLPDGKANNERLKLYTEAMAEVAHANGVSFVDIFAVSQALYSRSEKPLTINGIHPTEYGDSLLAPKIVSALCGSDTDAKLAPGTLEKIRQAVLDKDFMWFNRYRTVDGYSIFGGRADLVFKPDNQTNRVVAQREMEILDVMTSNRDKGIWAVAQGKEYKVDDSNTPDFIPVKTNKPGNGANGEHIFLSPEEQIKSFKLAKGLQVNLFASEREFPELSKPVQMSWDTQGRLWVAVWPSYPHWKPKEEMNDKILILEDTKGTGKADKCTVFADHLHCPTGFEFYNGGVLVAQAPDLLFLKDTTGSGKADYRQRVLSGIDSADTHHTANSFVLDPGGALYFQEGTFHHTQVETPWGPPLRNANAGVYRFEPRTFKFDAYVTYGFANPHGHIFDRWGRDIVIDGTGANPYDGALFSGHMEYPQKHASPPQVYKQRTRPCPGATILSSRHFPESMQGTMLVANVIFPTQGILQYRLTEKDASLAGTEETTPFLDSPDPNFRPSDLRIGPDGAVYFLDWQNPIIGHMQHNLRDPSRDRLHGRIYRISYEGRPLLKPRKIAGEPIDKLLDLLKEPEDSTHYWARIELGSRKSEDVIAAVKKWIGTLDKSDPDFEHRMLEALWVHQYHNVVNVDLLKRMLFESPDGLARAAATRVLCCWRDRVPDALDLVLKQAADRHPRVRLEAVRAASFFMVPEAVEAVLIAQEQPADAYIDFVRGETMKTLEPILKSALAKDAPIHFKTPVGSRYLLRNISTEKLLKMEHSRAVNQELLYRPGVRDEVRREAARSLGKGDGKSEPRVLLEAIANIDEKKETRDDSVVFDLVHLLTMRSPAELKDVRPELEKLATTAKQPVIRQIGYVAMMNVDGSGDRAWELAVKSVGSLRDLVDAVPLIGDGSLRAGMYARIEPLLAGLPRGLQTGAKTRSVNGRHVRIELPGKQRTLTLAEVEVYSDGKNVARQGKASQVNTAHGGDAARAIDGNKSGTYSDGGQTHTQEGVDNAWWEVDLGAEFPIQSIVIYNRTDGNLGQRLNNFTLKVLDRDRKVVFERTQQPAPAAKASFEVGTEDPERILRRSAMNALTSVRGQELKTFQALAKFVADADNRSDAIHALCRIPKSFWPKEEAAPLVDGLLAYIRKVPTQERTSPSAMDALEFAEALTTLLPADQAKKVRAELGELGVRVIRITTLPERMAYDKETIALKAGKPVEFLFENTDMMPHNFVIVQPGSLQEIGEMAEADATNPDAQARHFVPRSGKIMLSSVLLWPRDSQKLSFTAPQEPGVYPFVCTYPGHYRRMYGALYVVADLDDYLANPEAYLARTKLPIRDDLLKDRRPRTEWKLDDLASVVTELKSGRSYGNGKQMFQVATCMSCHKIEGVGHEFGPDLTKLDAKLKPVDILKDILEPSAKIDDKYRTWTFRLKSGKTVTGMILEETKETVKVIENPLTKAEPTIVKVSQIDERERSDVSMMPKGLLDKLTRDEILDLLAYIYSHADKNHDVFKGEHDHHHGSGH
jgi:putative heme-binding domain-containing protein